MTIMLSALHSQSLSDFHGNAGRLWILILTRFLNANQIPLRSKTLWMTRYNLALERFSAIQRNLFALAHQSDIPSTGLTGHSAWTGDRQYIAIYKQILAG
jgi:hypothetical protein